MRPVIRLWGLVASGLGLAAGCTRNEDQDSRVSAPKWFEAVHGGRIAHESFSYEEGSSVTRWVPLKFTDPSGRPDSVGSTGFPGPWEAGADNLQGGTHGFRVEYGSLVFHGKESLGLSSMNRLSAPAQGRMISMVRELPELPWKGRFFLSFLVRPEGWLDDGAGRGFFGVGFTTADRSHEIFFGKPGEGAMDRYVMEMRGDGQQAVSDIKVVVNEVAALVVEFEGSELDQRLTLRVNPSSQSDPGVELILVLPDKQFSHLLVCSTGAFSLDEIRITQGWPMAATK